MKPFTGSLGVDAPELPEGVPLPVGVSMSMVLGFEDSCPDCLLFRRVLYGSVLLQAHSHPESKVASGMW